MALLRITSVFLSTARIEHTHRRTTTRDWKDITATAISCEGGYSYASGCRCLLNVPRNNRESAMANGSIMRLSRYTLVHPMMCPDGGYPTDFSMPRPLEDFLEMGDKQLERILVAYELTPGGSWYDRTYRDDLISARYGYGYSQPRRLSRLVTLFEYLGAYRLAEQLRWRRPGLPMGLPRYGIPLTGY